MVFSVTNWSNMEKVAIIGMNTVMISKTIEVKKLIKKYCKIPMFER